MLYVSIFVELLRSRPSLAVWLAALAQALLWLLVPSLFYAAPPAELANVLAVGREFQLGTDLGPPLAFWLAEIAYDATAHSVVGVYLLSQVCVVVTYWAVFALGRSIVGPQHAALAVLLMVGVAAFTVPTPDFGPVILTMPLWAIILLHYWRAVGEGRRSYWLPLAIEIGLLLLTTYVGLILIGLLVLFTAREPGGARPAQVLRPADRRPRRRHRHGPAPDLAGRFGCRAHTGAHAPAHARGGVRQSARMAAADRIDPGGACRPHRAGGAGGGMAVAATRSAPVIVRPAIDPFARQFVYFFAIAPAFAGTLVPC